MCRLFPRPDATGRGERAARARTPWPCRGRACFPSLHTTRRLACPPRLLAPPSCPLSLANDNNRVRGLGLRGGCARHFVPATRQTALGTRWPTRSSSTGAASTGASPSSAPTASANRGTTEAEAPPSTRALPGAFTLAAAARCILPGPSPLQLDHQRAGRLANRVQRGAALVGYSCGDKRTD